MGDNDRHLVPDLRPEDTAESIITRLLKKGVEVTPAVEEVMEKEKMPEGLCFLQEMSLKDILLKGDRIWPEEIGPAASQFSLEKLPIGLILPMMEKISEDPEQMKKLKRVIVFSDQIDMGEKIGFFVVGPNSINVKEIDRDKVYFNENDNMLFLISE